MKKISAVVLLAVFLLPASVNFAEGIKWHNFNEGMKIAQKENKFLLVDFYTDWCHWCKVMDEKTYSDAGVQKTIEKYFVAVRINPEKSGALNYKNKEYTYSDFAGAAGVTGYPSTGLFSKSGDYLTTVTGYIDIPKFNSMVDYLLKGKYKDLSFEDYSLYLTLSDKLEKDKNNAGLNFVIGYFEKAVFKNNKKAKSYYKLALKINPDFPEALYELSKVYEISGDSKKAARLKNTAAESGITDDAKITAKLKEIIQRELK